MPSRRHEKSTRRQRTRRILKCCSLANSLYGLGLSTNLFVTAVKAERPYVDSLVQF